jgi:hypothetical protein
MSINGRLIYLFSCICLLSFSSGLHSIQPFKGVGERASLEKGGEGNILL